MNNVNSVDFVAKPVNVNSAVKGWKNEEQNVCDTGGPGCISWTADWL
jgi:hypothetical protein